MTARELIDLLQIQGIGGIAIAGVLVILTLVQISPLQINPWTKSFRWLGKQINHETNKKIDAIEKKLDDHIEKYTIQRVDDIRNTILIFANECSRGIVHSKEQFRYIISKCDDYEQYIEENNMKNGVIAEATKLIRETYQRRLKHDDFLKGEK